MKNYLKNTLRLALLCSLLFVTSCKKEKIDSVRPSTYEDFEKVMETDLNFNLFVSKSIELEDLMLSKYKPSILTDLNNQVKELNLQEQQQLLKMKSFNEMSQYLNNHHYFMADKIVNALEEQVNLFRKFIIKYPEFTKLSKSEKQSILTSKIKNRDNINTSNIYNNFKTSYIRKTNQEKIMYAEDPAQVYGQAIELCQANYRREWIDIMIGYDAALLLASFETAYLGTVVASVVMVALIINADNARATCMNDAATTFYRNIF